MGDIWDSSDGCDGWACCFGLKIRIVRILDGWDAGMIGCMGWLALHSLANISTYATEKY